MSYTEVTSGPHKWNMHSVLVNNLEIMKRKNANDWDFKVLISGDGMTRTGKSTLAFQIAQFIDPTFAENWKDRIIFDGTKLIETAYKIGKNKAIVYDEAKESLDSKKQMEGYTKKLLDFFSQCGNLNHEIIIVLPEYFELPKSIALTQTIFLINCYTKDGFERGYFEFYNRKDKKKLYILGAKYLDYGIVKATFEGNFINWIPFNREEYEAYKTEQLHKLRKKESLTTLKTRSETHRVRVKILIQYLNAQGITNKAIAEMLGVDPTTLNKVYLKEVKYIDKEEFNVLNSD